MKYFAYNGSLSDPSECGGFTVVARKLNEEFTRRGIIHSKIDTEEPFVLIPECIDTKQKFFNTIPYLASEYSLPPKFTIDWLKLYNPTILTISEFARKNLINGGYPAEKIHTVLLGSDSNFWKPTGAQKFRNFTYLTVNSSNDRSGLEELIPAFLEFAVDKENVQLLIKDGKNEKFSNWIKSLNNKKIVYIDTKFDNVWLRQIYNRAHIHCYFNHCSSFGMNHLDSVLCGTPNICTWGSAVPEFTPEWTQPIKVKTVYKPLDHHILNKWSEIGLHTPPPNFYPEGTMREAVNKNDIIPYLKYSYDNYLELLDINQKHQEYIKEYLSWAKTVDEILEVLDNE